MTGISTKHKGRQFRSRLEARWANFFDLVGWKYEYEPFDLPGWIPDFVLYGEKEVLVEIKPVSSFPADIAVEIERSASGWPGELLILGSTVPVPKMVTTTSFGWLTNRKRSIHQNPGSWVPEDPGYWETYPGSWDEAVLGRWWNREGGAGPHRVLGSTRTDGVGTIGFCYMVGSTQDRISGGQDRGFGGLLLSPDEIAHLWTEAGNRVQWRPPPA